MEKECAWVSDDRNVVHITVGNITLVFRRWGERIVLSRKYSSARVNDSCKYYVPQPVYRAALAQAAAIMTQTQKEEPRMDKPAPQRQIHRSTHLGVSKLF